MLKRFEVENFYSIRDRQRLDLEVDATAPDLPSRLARPFPASEDRVARVVAIFGPNASGKSNVLKALSFLMHFVRGSASWQPDGREPYFTFGTKAAWQKPTRLYIEFYGRLLGEEKHSVYSYEVVFKNDHPKGSAAVEYEALRYSPKGKSRRLFERKAGKFFTAPEFLLKKSDQRFSFVGIGQSALSIFAHFNHEPSGKIVRALNTIQSNINSLNRLDVSSSAMTSWYDQHPHALSRLKQRMRMMDLGIEDITIEKQHNGKGPLFKHTGLDSRIVLEFESEGTQSFYRLFPLLSYTLEVGGLAIIDELDRDIHPLLLPEVIKWFHDPELNKLNAQLVMSCHNATLLEYLIKEEVFFTEKASDGSTSLFALQDIHGVRRETNLYAKYLAGLFGGVPRIG